jgi:hypothetical protein
MQEHDPKDAILWIAISVVIFVLMMVLWICDITLDHRTFIIRHP